MWLMIMLYWGACIQKVKDIKGRIATCNFCVQGFGRELRLQVWNRVAHVLHRKQNRYLIKLRRGAYPLAQIEGLF